MTSAPCRSRSWCQRSSASPKRLHASSASTSSQLPGKRRTPNFIRRVPPSTAGGAKTEQPKDASPKACASKSRAEDAGMRRFAASSGVLEQLHFVVLDQRIGEQLLAQAVELRGVLHV